MSFRRQAEISGGFEFLINVDLSPSSVSMSRSVDLPITISQHGNPMLRSYQLPSDINVIELIREMARRAQSSMCDQFTSARTNKSTYIFSHQLDRGGGDKILPSRKMKASEGRYGDVTVRAHAHHSGDSIKRNMVYFTTRSVSESNIDELSGMKWRVETVELIEVLYAGQFTFLSQSKNMSCGRLPS